METYNIQYFMDGSTSYIITMNISSFVKFLEAFSKTFALENSFVPYLFILFHQTLIDRTRYL